MAWCQKRLTCKDLMVRFGDGKHRFYLESVCGASVLDIGGHLCKYCSTLVPQTKTQDVGTFSHGLVSGSYTKESHIYDSPWYHTKVKAYGQPTSEDLDLAMEAQKKARAGVRAKTKETIVKKSVAAADEEAEAAPVVAAAPVAAEPVKPKKKRAPAKKKTAIVPTEDLQSSVLTQLGAVHETVLTSVPEKALAESMDTPLEIKEVIRVILRPFEHDDTTYWRDSSREKLYKRTAKNTMGEYIGRWDSITKTIVRDAPDSDLEF
jgi:hypothetical protein